ncbi:hypothetical protein HY212_04430 [Candidatus Pacearchaeota archaeon]|nr:hypothetical protein [Candidatus Pacearchaeota archaeon]
MPIHNIKPHNYRTFFGDFKGKTWVKEHDDGSFGIRLNGEYVSNTQIFGYRRKFYYTLDAKRNFPSIEEVEAYFSNLSQEEVIKAMKMAQRSQRDITQAFSLDPIFTVF